MVLKFIMVIIHIIHGYDKIIIYSSSISSSLYDPPFPPDPTSSPNHHAIPFQTLCMVYFLSIRSRRQKTSCIFILVSSSKASFLTLPETWLSSTSNDLICGLSCTPGYNLLHTSKIGRAARVIALIVTSSFKLNSFMLVLLLRLSTLLHPYNLFEPPYIWTTTSHILLQIW